MQRILSTAVIVGLLAATAAAFAITERLKLTKSPITGTKVVRPYVSPPAHTTAAINVRFRRSDRVSVTILDAHRAEVDTLAYRLLVRPERRTFTWNGRTDTGAVPKDGTYFMEIHLENQRRTILLPNPLTLETKLPAVLDAGAARAVFSPDGDHQFDTVTIHYKLSEGARALVLLHGRRIILSRSHKAKNKVSWGGTVAGRLLPPGRYVLTVSAQDLAGNKATTVKQVAVTIRYIRLAASQVIVGAGAHVRIGVSTDAKRYRWTLGTRRGVASGKVLKLRAPAIPGTYVLSVTEHGHSDRATVTVK